MYKSVVEDILSNSKLGMPYTVQVRLYTTMLWKSILQLNKVCYTDLNLNMQSGRQYVRT